MIQRKIVLTKASLPPVVCGILFLLVSCQVQQAPETLPSVDYLISDATTALDLPFSDAVRVGHMLYLSGQLGAIPGAATLVPGGITEETKRLNG